MSAAPEPLAVIGGAAYLVAGQMIAYDAAEICGRRMDDADLGIDVGAGEHGDYAGFGNADFVPTRQVPMNQVSLGALSISLGQVFRISS